MAVQGRGGWPGPVGHLDFGPIVAHAQCFEDWDEEEAEPRVATRKHQAADVLSLHT